MSIGEKMMKRKISPLVALVSALCTAAPAMSADMSHLRVVDKPLNLTVHLHDKKFTYNNDWPVEKEAERLTGVKLSASQVLS